MNYHALGITIVGSILAAGIIKNVYSYAAWCLGCFIWRMGSRKADKRIRELEKLELEDKYCTKPLNYDTKWNDDNDLMIPV